MSTPKNKFKKTKNTFRMFSCNCPQFGGCNTLLKKLTLNACDVDV